MEFSERLLVLHKGTCRESDIWLKLLSPSRGLFSAFAFGGSRSRRRFTGCLDIFNQVLFRVKASRGQQYMALEEGVLIKGVEKIRTDWIRLGMAKNCSSFLQSFGITGEGAIKAHDLMLAVLEHLEGAESVSPQLPVFFRLRLAAEQGYFLGFQHCGFCGGSLDSSACILVREGVVCCAACSRDYSGLKRHLSCDSLYVLSRIIQDAPAQWGLAEGRPLPSDIRRECGQAIDGFIQYHIGLSFENGYFKRH